jgi:O-antigen/teichoic acid export membrane protein
MGESEFAAYTIAFSIIVFVSQPIVDIANRSWIVYQDRLKFGSQLLSIFSLQTGFVILILLPVGLLFQMPGKILVFMFLATVAIASIELVKTFYQRELRFNRYMVVEIVRAVLFLACVVAIVIFYREDMQAWMVLFVQAMSAFVVALPILAFNLFGVRLSDVRRGVINVFSRVRSLHLFLVGYVILQSVISQMDIFMLKVLSPELELATYGSAFRYYGFILVALASLQTVLLPVIQRATHWDEITSIFQRHRGFVLLFTPLVLLGMWLANWVLPWVDVGKYPGAVATFQILSVSAIISFTFGVYAIISINFRMFGQLFVFTTASLLINLVLNYALITRYGATGAAAATLVTHLFFNIAMFVTVRRRIEAELRPQPLTGGSGLIAAPEQEPGG